ncbi:zinc finger protein 83 isoform X4 [Aethina tumida]|uniref:zinc finger protein 83 isoform X4 n=1 Tax=Aethina tumida TaxID=116153 RepID=UPI00214861AB|nr:zinc finger protein 83 isoform X4 [Aethina tumida]
MDNGGDILQLCRLCLVKDQVNIPIFEEQGDIRQIFLKISSCLPVKVTPDDKLPKKICDGCSCKLDMLYEFWNTTANAEKQLVSWLDQAGLKANTETADQTMSVVAQQVSSKPSETVVKEEAADEIFMEEITFSEKWEEASSSAGPSATITSDEPPPKRARRAAAVRASLNVAAESDDEDDLDTELTKIEDESEDEDDAEVDDPSYVDAPSTSADDQPGPSGVGKDGGDAPDIMSLFMPEISIEEVSEDGMTNSNLSKSKKQNKVLNIPKKRGRPKKDTNAHPIETLKAEKRKVKRTKMPQINLPNISIAELKVKLKEMAKDINVKPVRESSRQNGIEYDIKPEFVEVIEHLEEEDTRLFKCPICKDEEERTLSKLKLHYKDEHKGKRLRASKFSNELHPCDICGKTFKSLAGVKDHIETHNMYFHCDNCNNSYKKLADYIVHLRTHSEEGVFRCLVCEITTEDINSITEHVHSKHTDVEDYKYYCSSCKKGFHLESWYQEHDNFHTGLKPFDCDICGKSFMYTRFLQAHKFNMHKDEISVGPNLHICVICKKEYQHKNSLKLHMNSHTGNYSICDICGKILSSKEKLKFHLRTHTGYKPFSCSYCGKCFTKKPILVEHVRIHTGERPYVCEHCNKAFSQRSSLVIHIRSHTGERPYVCELCGKGFVAKAMLNIHMKSCKGRIPFESD